MDTQRRIAKIIWDSHYAISGLPCWDALFSNRIMISQDGVPDTDRLKTTVESVMATANSILDEMGKEGRMREAASKLKELISKKEIVPIYSCYIVKDGNLLAGNGQMFASVPVKCPSNFVVRAVDFGRFLDKTPGDIKIEVQENHWVKVKCGRFRATIPGFDPSNGWSQKPQGTVTELSPVFVDKLRAVRPFISQNATQPWSGSALCRGDDIIATNNVVLVKAQGSGLRLDQDIMIDQYTADHIIANPTGLVSMQYCDNSVSFHWKDGAWLMALQSVVKFPNFDPIFANYKEPQWMIPEEWREAYLHVSSLSVTDEIKWEWDKIVSGQSDAYFVADVSGYTVPEGRTFTSWNRKFTDTVIEQATHLDTFISGGPRAFFKTPHAIGVMAGMGR